MFKNYSKEQKGYKKCDIELSNDQGRQYEYIPRYQGQGHNVPEHEAKTALPTSPVNNLEFSDDAKQIPLKTESDDEFSHFSFPTIGFCDRPSKANSVISNYPRIGDLCKEDRQRIAQLVKEIARYKEEENLKQSEQKRILDEKNELKEKIGKLEKELSVLHLSVKYNDENVKFITKTYSSKENTLKSQNLELQTSLTSLKSDNSILQSKLDEAQKQIERLSNAIYNVSMENKLMNKKYDHSKEKLKSALDAIRILEDEVKEKALKVTETRGCQTENVLKESKKSKIIHRKDCDKFYRCSSSWKKTSEERSSDEDSLISELFFIPKQKNIQKSNYFSDDDF